MKKSSILWLLAALLLFPKSHGEAEEVAYRKVVPLLSTTQTILEEPLQKSDGSPLQITSAIVTIQPGEETAWHQHGVPMYAYILSGAVTVDYGDKGIRTFTSGQAMVEAMHHWHRGTNPGDEPVRILVVYVGAEEGKNVILKK